MNEPVTIKEVMSSAKGGTGWLVECSEHSWFRELSFSMREFAETHADRHLKTYHGKS